MTLWAQSRALRVPSCRACCCEEDPLPQGGRVTVTPSRLLGLVSDGDRLPLGLQAARATPTLSAGDEAQAHCCLRFGGRLGPPLAALRHFLEGDGFRVGCVMGTALPSGNGGPAGGRTQSPYLGGLGVPSPRQGHLLSSPSSLSTPFPSAGSAETHSGHPHPSPGVWDAPLGPGAQGLLSVPAAQPSPLWLAMRSPREGCSEGVRGEPGVGV